MTLKELPIGKTATVRTVGGEGALRQHFLDMGIIPGAEVTMVKYGPTGDPVEVRIYSYDMTLRLADAGRIAIDEMRDAVKERAAGCESNSASRLWREAESTTIRQREIRCREGEACRPLRWPETRTAARPPCSTN